MKNTNRNWLKLTIYLVLTAGFVSAMAMTISRNNKSSEKTIVATTTDIINEDNKEKSEAEKKSAEESKAAFLDAYNPFPSGPLFTPCKCR